MTIRDDVQAIRQDTGRTPQQRYADGAALKCNAIRDAIIALGPLPQTWTLRGVALTLRSAVATGTQLVIVLTATRGGVRIPINNPIIIENPPILVTDPGGLIVIGGRPFRLDLVAVARSILESVSGA